MFLRGCIEHAVLHTLLYQLKCILQPLIRDDVQNMKGTYEFIRYQYS